MELTPIAGTELTEYTINILRKHHVTTLQQFLDTAHDKLSKIIHVSEKAINRIRNILLQRHYPQPVLLYNLYKDVVAKRITYGTGIVGLDEMLGPDEILHSGCVWEICGASGVGKSQLCHTIAVNLVANLHEANILYIDTKCDFSGTRIRQMLRKRNVDTTECGRIMNAIKVERTLSAHGVINILEQLKLQLNSDTVCAEVNSIKLVIIDALPAVWLGWRSDHVRLESNYLLALLANYVHKLAKQHYIAFILLNLWLPVENPLLLTTGSNAANEIDPEDCDDNAGEMKNDNSEVVTMRPALGYYWKSVPRIRLLLETGNNEEDATLRIIKVIKSCYSPTGVSCNVHIREEGVI